jgi:hypothetical protein
MTDLRKAAQMALDWRDKNGELLFALGGWDFIFEINNWSQSLRGALAQPEPEPVWVEVTTNTGDKFILDPAVEADKIRAAKDVGLSVVPLYTALPQREWQGLTENEIKHLWYEACQTNLELTSQLIVHLARNIEAKLKERNT